METITNLIYRNGELDCDQFFHQAFVSCATPDKDSAEYLFRNRKKPEVRERLICGNLRLVYSVLRKTGYAASMENVMTGIMGLIRAVDRFDPTRGNQFSTYAFDMILHALQKERGETFIHTSSYCREKLQKLEKAENALQSELGRPPSEQELAEKTGFSPEALYEICSIRDQCRNPISLSVPAADKLEQFCVQVEETPEERAMRKALWSTLRKQVEELTPREQTILRMRYGFQGETMSYQAIGNLLGISKERVRKICGGILKKLRDCPDLTR